MAVNQMRDGGTHNSEEIMIGDLENGNTIIVETIMFEYYENSAPLMDARFWEAKWENGEFADDENEHMVRMYDANGMFVRVPLSDEEAYASYRKASMLRSEVIARKRSARRSRPARQGR